MGVFKADGTRVTKATFPSTPHPDPLLVITEDLNATVSSTGNHLVKLNEVLAKNGDVIRQSELSVIFPDAVLNSVAPLSGAAAGGTVVTIKGHHLDGTTAVSFDGAAGTALTVVDDDTVRVTTPAGTVGPADIAVTTDAGTVTLSGGYTYA